MAVLIWLFLWRSTFSTIENSTSLLGLITLAFVVAAVRHHPPAGELLAGMLPSLPHHDPAKYWFIAVSILGAVIAPYLFYFYSSGAVEDKWDASYIGVNRGIALIGMGFGSLIALARDRGRRHGARPAGHPGGRLPPGGDDADGRLPVLGVRPVRRRHGDRLPGRGARGRRCRWRTRRPRRSAGTGARTSIRAEDARFCLVYTGAILLSSLLILFGVDPLKLTLLTMAINAAVLPFVAIPFLLLMNDRKLLGSTPTAGSRTRSPSCLLVLAFVLAVVSIPLAILGGS